MATAPTRLCLSPISLTVPQEVLLGGGALPVAAHGVVAVSFAVVAVVAVSVAVVAVGDSVIYQGAVLVLTELADQLGLQS